MPLVRKFSETSPPEFLNKLLTALAKLDGFEIELLTRDDVDGWTHLLIRFDEEIGTIASLRIAAFRLKSRLHGSCVIAINPARPEEFAHREVESGNPVSAYSIAYEMAQVLFHTTHAIAKICEVVVTKVQREPR